MVSVEAAVFPSELRTFSKGEQCGERVNTLQTGFALHWAVLAARKTNSDSWVCDGLSILALQFLKYVYVAQMPVLMNWHEIDR